MSDKCESYKALIPRILLYDAPSDLQGEVEAHLSTCESCRTEHAAYLQTIRMLETVEDEPVPRHFLLPEQAVRPTLLDWLRALSLPRKLAASATMLAVMAFFWLAVSGAQFKADNGVYAFSFGPPLPDLSQDQSAELEAFKTEVQGYVRATIHSEREQYLAMLKTEVERSSSHLNDAQKRSLSVALAGLEERMNQRIAVAKELLENQTTLSVETLYDTVQEQRRQDLTVIRNSMVQNAIKSEVKDLQTQVVLNTLLEATDLRLRGIN